MAKGTNIVIPKVKVTDFTKKGIVVNSNQAFTITGKSGWAGGHVDKPNQ